MIFYTNHFIPVPHAACARGPFIFIRPEHKDDEGLRAHEQTHVDQFWSLPIIHGLLYLLSKKYRLRCEVAAYREQLKFSPESAPAFARLLSRNYNLDVTEAAALELLIS